MASLAAIKPSAQENSKSKSKKCNTVKSTQLKVDGEYEAKTK
ncbi:hypothetical protein AG0111_0g701 [Alternaria gaisen]|uniref:Uncharacterized protein n=1 Tax=Alternaria gaisen TaxID=167740 RepID=A0ACB6FZ21_9PLEO|nr:hypothetical protein AG0111_0g701 [Alternaria gaisen]